MAFDYFEDSIGSRRQAEKKRKWQRFWLALSCGTLLLLGTVALLMTINRMDNVEPHRSNMPVARIGTIQSPDHVSARPPNPILEAPRDRPPPQRVNDFLAQEQSRNASRCDLLRSAHQLDIATDFRSHCQPQWDFRDPRREVIWFYYYTSGVFQGEPLTVFGAVDGMGNPLHQHPAMAGDPLALLDSQYDTVKWISLDTPRVALIAAATDPTEDLDQVVDLFLVNDVSPGTPRTWRFGGDFYQEQPLRTFQLICFLDADDDGYRDLCALDFEQQSEQTIPTAIYFPYKTEQQTFSTTSLPGSDGFESRLYEIHTEVQTENHQILEPYLIKESALEPAIAIEPEPVEEGSEAIE